MWSHCGLFSIYTFSIYFLYIFYILPHDSYILIFSITVNKKENLVNVSGNVSGNFGIVSDNCDNFGPNDNSTTGNTSPSKY
jgi:hypothetical protein